MQYALHYNAYCTWCSVDGLHQQDLAQWVALKPSSTLAALSKEGVTYTGEQRYIGATSGRQRLCPESLIAAAQLVLALVHNDAEHQACCNFRHVWVHPHLQLGTASTLFI